MDTLELRREQQRLASKIVLRDGFEEIKTIAGIDTQIVGNKLLACVVVCEYPSLKVIESQTYTLNSPLPYKPGFQAYREMPAMIEAYNKLSQEADVILVKGEGILHPRRMGVASHLGLSLNQATIGISASLTLGKVNEGKIIYDNEVCGFEIVTREHANPVYISPGHLITLGSALELVTKTLRYPHKMPEPLHLVHKILRRNIKEEGFPNVEEKK
ncbi:MAG: endonuclease V [Candidatus Woesearchaeota archaeon]|jgi:deoxyribonuclease V